MLCVVCCVDVSFAQRYLEYDIYKESDYKADTVVLSDCKYILDTFMDGVAVYIYNAQNHPGRDDVRWANGDYIDDIWGFSLEPVVFTETLLDTIDAITDNAFTEEQIAKFGDDFFQINLDISSSTGEVMDVYFMIFPDTYYANVPIEVFRKMELQFKDIVFELTEQGRNMTYVYLSWETTPRRKSVPNEDPKDGSEEEINENEIETEVKVVTPISGAVSKGTLTPTLNRKNTIGTVATP